MFTGITNKENVMDHITRPEEKKVTVNSDHYVEMFALLTTIAVFSDDERYAKQADELVRKIRWSEGR